MVSKLLLMSLRSTMSSEVAKVCGWFRTFGEGADRTGHTVSSNLRWGIGFSTLNLKLLKNCVIPEELCNY